MPGFAHRRPSIPGGTGESLSIPWAGDLAQVIAALGSDDRCRPLSPVSRYSQPDDRCRRLSPESCVGRSSCHQILGQESLAQVMAANLPSIPWAGRPCPGDGCPWGLQNRGLPSLRASPKDSGDPIQISEQSVGLSLRGCSLPFLRGFTFGIYGLGRSLVHSCR